MKKLFALVLALAMVLPLAACGSNGQTSNGSNGGASSPAANTPEGEDGEVVLRVGTSDNMGSFLIGGGSGSNYRGVYLAFDSIFYFDENNEPYSTVLEDWYYEDDCTFVMELKNGIYFSDGEQMDAEDLLFSVFVYSETGSAFAGLYSEFNQEKSYVSEDGMTAYLISDEPFGPGLFQANLPIYSKDWADEVGLDSELWMTNPVGSGPYICTDYQTDASCTLEKRDDYWDDTYENEIDKYIITYYKEDSTMYIDLETGAIDVACNISNSDYARGVDGGTKNVAVEQLMCGDVIFLNMDVDDNQYLADPKVREAIAYGVNWMEVARASRGDMATAATSIIAVDSPYHVDVGAYEYDPERAAKALAESSFAGQEISIYLVNLNEEVKDEMATVLQYYLSELGITMTFEDFDFPNALTQWLEVGGTDITFQDSDTGSLSGEPFVSLRFMMEGYGPFPVCTVNDPTFEDLAMKAIQTVDHEERLEYYTQLQEYSYENYLMIPIFNAADAIAWRTDVVESTGIQNPTDANLRNVKLVH